LPVGTAADLRFDASYLIDECPPPHIDGTVPIRIHGG
jgi:hypothetical protein